ncbi:MAG: HEPN domain-containing protein [Actinobacteria bacterium]|nr:HEPN domain-containing protein [Actinomycetota bacterium]MCG2818261.1 HEPN domain-containing protein [Actinomycetes bacterium]MBU4219585.1 HEPN domain-containing protein [Actinomycetota bacterium]MBU4358798.1 HEPN domain-containing protein [Actinomycetota bacterium]MBU4391439.1 HEPN domain-containing protein [Actinomycetota bacterium]
MSGEPESTHTVVQWIEKAENDLRNAEYTLTLQDNCPFDTICFHAQQCAEKYLKGLLFFLSISFPKTHDLEALTSLVPDDISLGLDMGAVLSLNRYTIEARYPGDWEPIARTEAENAVDVARRVREAVRNNLPDEITGR